MNLVILGLAIRRQQASFCLANQRAVRDLLFEENRTQLIELTW